MARLPGPRLRVTVILGAAALLATALSACGDDAPADTKTLTILSSFTTGNSTGDEFNKLAKKFTDQTGIKIDVEEANTNDIAGNYEASKLADKERDLVILNLTPATTDWLPQGQVVDVRKYVDQWGLADKLEPKAVEYWTQGDKGLAGFPYVAFNWPVWYNMDLLKKAGVNKIPATVPELVDAAGKLRAAGIQPMALGGGEWPVQNFTTWMAQQFLTPQEAQQIFAKGGYCASPNAVRGLDLFAQLRDAGVFIDNVQGYTADQMTTAYFNGKAAMMPSGSWSFTTASPAMGAATELAGFPTVPGSTYPKPTAFNGFNSGFFLSPNGAKKIESVEKFIKFMYDQPTLQSWVSDASQILAVTPAALGTVKAANPLAVKGNAISKDTVDFLVLPDSYIPSGVDYQPVATAFLGKKGETGAQFCKALDKLYTDK